MAPKKWGVSENVLQKYIYFPKRYYICAKFFTTTIKLFLIMKRIYSLIILAISLLCSSSIKAQTEETFTRTISLETGTFTNKQGNSASAYKYMWQSTDENPRLTLQTTNNDIWLDGDGTFHLYIRKFTLSVPDGYAITGYSFDFTGFQGASTTTTRADLTVTPSEGGDAVECKATDEAAHFAVSGIEKMQTFFTVSSSESQANIVPTSFTVTIKKVKTIVEMIQTTSVKDGEFAGNTVWYRLNVGKGQTTNTFPLIYLGDYTSFDLKKTTTDFADNMLWCFSGNNTDGFTIYCREGGATKVLASPKEMSGTNGGTAYPIVLPLNGLDESKYETLWTMEGSSDIAGEAGVYLMQKSTSYAVNNRDQKLAFWTKGKDIGSTIVLTPVAADLRIGSAYGTFANKPGTTSAYMASFTSENTVPATLTFANGKSNNNMMPEEDGDGARLYDATSGPTYNLTTEKGYIVDSYSFDHTGAFTTLEASEGSYTNESNHFSVTDVNSRIASFTIGGNDLAKNFRVFIREGEPVVYGLTTTVFDNANSAVPYRIPGLAQLSTGRLLAICDYRISKTDIGYNNRNGLYQINEVLKYSDDGGRTWSDTIVFARGNENATEVWRTAFGDPSIVVDRDTDEILVQCVSGKVGYFSSTRSNPQNCVFFRSKDGGLTWDEGSLQTEQIYGLYDGYMPDGAKVAGIFLTSGKIMQSRYIKVGDYYRLYIAHPMRSTTASKYAAWVIYSDDFGYTWHVLGGTSTKPSDAADESKVEELPDGSVLLSCRNQGGGRKFNIFRYSDRAKGEGTWSTDAMPSNMTGSFVNACNGEILVVPAKRNSDGQQLFVALQSVPLSSSREKVGFFYKELASYDDYNTGAKLAEGWTKGLQVTNLDACYSTMIRLQNDSIGFLYEESLYNEGYNIIYKEFSLDTITAGKYSIDPTSPRDQYLRDHLSSRLEPVEVGTAVGMCKTTEPLDQARQTFDAAPSDDSLFGVLDAATNLPRVELEEGKDYFLMSKNHANYYLSVDAVSEVLIQSAENDSTQLFQFVPDEGGWQIMHKNSGLFIGRAGATSSNIPVVDASYAYVYTVTSDLSGWSTLACNDAKNTSYPAIAMNRTGNIRPLALTNDYSLWRIQPRYIPTDINEIGLFDDLQSDDFNGQSVNGQSLIVYDLQGRRLSNSKLSNGQIHKGVYILNGKKMIQ